MKILISGCSFTKWPEFPGGPNTCWPKFITDHEITNIAEAAAGNQYICDSVIQETIQRDYDMVLVMWSGVSRLDYLTDITDPHWNSLYDSYGFYRRLDNGKLGWIFSGGQMGTWYKNPVAHKMFYEQYKVSSPLSLAHINLSEIIKLQSYLQVKKIPYRFMSYVNYWNGLEDVSPNGDFGIMNFPEISHMINAIDWDQWIFSNTERDGIYELSKELNDFMSDGFHPGQTAHQRWAELIMSRI
jgi:hypothetical protein